MDAPSFEEVLRVYRECAPSFWKLIGMGVIEAPSNDLKMRNNREE